MLFRRHYDAYIYKSLKRITAWHCLPDNDGAGIIRRHITGNTQFVLIKSTESPTRPVAILVGKCHVHCLTVNSRIGSKDVHHERQITITVAVIMTDSKQDIINCSRVVIFRLVCQG